MQGMVVHSPSVAASKVGSMRVRSVERQHNKRLKLSAPGVCGKIPFVIIRVWRRSLGAIR